MQPVMEPASDSTQPRHGISVYSSEPSFSTIPSLSASTPWLEGLVQPLASTPERPGALEALRQAYHEASTPTDKTRLFEQLRQGLLDQQEYDVLVQLAQDYTQQTSTSQERALGLLATGEALLFLQRPREARQEYLIPALELDNVPAETRLQLLYTLGLSQLAEQSLAEAAVTFRQAVELTVGQPFANATTPATGPRTQLHHLRNAARLYDGIIHLLYHRPQQAVHTLQELQRPLTTGCALNSVLFQALACRIMAQSEAAARALQAVARTVSLPELLRGPMAVIRAGVANLRGSTTEAGEHLEAALHWSLVPRTSWEPSWYAMALQELGLALHSTGYRAAAVGCYEEAIAVVMQRAGVSTLAASAQATNFLAVLAEQPVEQWPDTLRGELGDLLQTLAWLTWRDAGRTEAILAYAARLGMTTEQEAALWCQRSWHALTMSGVQALPDEWLRHLQDRAETCTHPGLLAVLRSLIALVQGNTTLAEEGFAHFPAVQDVPQIQTLGVAAWLWAHGRRGTLGHELGHIVEASSPWQSPFGLAMAMEKLLLWQADSTSSVGVDAWLTPLLTAQPDVTFEALGLLCQPGYLDAPREALLAALGHLYAQTSHLPTTDRLAALLGGPVLLERIARLLADLAEHLGVGSEPAAAMRTRKKRQRRGAAPQEEAAADMARVLELIGMLAGTASGEAELPGSIAEWLLRSPSLCAQAPEVVSALLGVLRQCPTAGPVMQTLLEKLPLSRRQRQGLEAAIQTPITLLGSAALSWEELRLWPLDQLLAALKSPSENPGEAMERDSRTHYILAVLYARVGLIPRAIASLRACLSLQPEQPLAHYTLSVLLGQQHQEEAALEHALHAWKALSVVAAPVRLLHLHFLHHLMALLIATRRYDQLVSWIKVFQQHRLALEPATTHLPQLDEVEEGFLQALSLYLSSVVALTDPEALAIAEQHLSAAAGLPAASPYRRRLALYHQAATCLRQQHYPEAMAALNTLLQQQPAERQAQIYRALLQALVSDAPGQGEVETFLVEAFTLLGEAIPALAASPTAENALAWLQQVSVATPHTADVVDLLVIYGGRLVEQGDFATAIPLLTPVYTLAPQPLAAYYLSEAHFKRSLESAVENDKFQESELALQYVQVALENDMLKPRAADLLPRLQEHHRQLVEVRQNEELLTAYCEQVCNFFTRYQVPFQEEVVSHAPDAPWLELHETVDIDENSGELVTTVQLTFNHNAKGAEPRPSEQDVALYAQHQRDAQLLVKTHGLEALSWPHVPYEGTTDFATIFPERLALNRDLLFIAFADQHAILRYGRVLQQMLPTLLASEEGRASSLTVAARYAVLLPLVQQRLRTFASAASSKALQRQITELQTALRAPSDLMALRTVPTFADAFMYFQSLVDPLRSHLDTPPTERERERANGSTEERVMRRPSQKKRRQRQPRMMLQEEEEE